MYVRLFFIIIQHAHRIYILSKAFVVQTFIL